MDIFIPAGKMASTARMSDKIKLLPGETMLVMGKDGTVIHFTPNMGLPHSEFVKRTRR